MTEQAPDRGPLVLKLGGELVDDTSSLQLLARAISRIATAGGPLIVVHGGGKEIDASLKTAGIEKRQVDGVRITDEPTLEVVIAVLAGAINTRLVARLHSAGVVAVGLTGADGRCGLSDVAPPHRAVDGRLVDLGRVGVPSGAADMRLLTTLTDNGFVPVISSIGLAGDGRLLNINADAFAGHVAARLGARRLIIAGTTAGVLDTGGRTLPVIEADEIGRLVSGRTATAGMIAKLRACERALSNGAGEVVIVDGRDTAALEASALGDPPTTATRLRAAVRAQGA
jgi:acetylglutamate kinase